MDKSQQKSVLFELEECMEDARSNRSVDLVKTVFQKFLSQSKIVSF